MSAMRDRIVKKYGEGVLRKSALNIREGAGAFEWAMQGRGYKTALEIGTYRGCSAAEMSQFCDRVVTVDLRYGKTEMLGENWNRQEFWKSIGVSNIEQILVDDDEEKAAILAAVPFDFAFVDGAHDRGVAIDFDLVKRCGNVLFHDADDNRLRAKNPGAPNHVFEFISTLPAHELEFKDIFALWTAGGKRG